MEEISLKKVLETANLDWKIKEFHYLCSATSACFQSSNTRKQFQLKLKVEDSFVLFALECLNGTKLNCDDLFCQYRVSVLDKRGQKQWTNEFNWNYNQTNGVYQRGSIDRHIYCKYLVNWNLKIVCEVAILKYNPISFPQEEFSRIKKIEFVQKDLQKDYQALLESCDFSDVVLVVKDKEFKVHKSILAARSPVFKAMFRADLDEAKQNRVEITDIDEDVFEHLLKFIYTGMIPDLGEFGLELFIAADKYQLKILKRACEQFLCTNFTPESVVSILAYADMHNAAKLKSKCIQYIKKNLTSVKETDSWKKIVSRPVLLMEVFDSIASKVDSMSCK